MDSTCLSALTQEAQSGRILLKDKTKDQLTEVLNHLDLRNGAEPPPVTEKNVELLVQCADEYEAAWKIWKIEVLVQENH